MEGFKHIYAPFTGVLTKRNYDVGALINAGSAGQMKELFDIAQIDPLRVYVSVPQNYAPSIKPGLKASVELQEMPGQKFDGQGGADLGHDRSGDAHAADRGGCSQSRSQTAAGLLRAGAFRGAGRDQDA